MVLTKKVVMFSKTYILVLFCVEVEKYTITKLAFVLLQHCVMMHRRLNEKDKTNQRRRKKKKQPNKQKNPCSE